MMFLSDVQYLQIETKRLVTKAINLFPDKQKTGLEVNYHRVVNCRMTERLEDFAFEDFLSALESGYVGLQHECAPTQ